MKTSTSDHAMLLQVDEGTGTGNRMELKDGATLGVRSGAQAHGASVSVRACAPGCSGSGRTLGTESVGRFPERYYDMTQLASRTCTSAVCREKERENRYTDVSGIRLPYDYHAVVKF